MATNYNSELTNELRDVGKIQTGRDRIPNEFADKIVPVIDVNPKHARVANIVTGAGQSSTGTATIYTTPSDRDFYLCSIVASMIKDAACDSATGAYSIVGVINGASRTLMSFSILTLTAQASTREISFSVPIKLDRGTSITFAGAFAAGALRRDAHITGYVSDNPNA